MKLIATLGLLMSPFLFAQKAESPVSREQCVVKTSGHYTTTFTRCRKGDVMTGIYSLSEPTRIICASAVAECLNRDIKLNEEAPND